MRMQPAKMRRVRVPELAEWPMAVGYPDVSGSGSGLAKIKYHSSGNAKEGMVAKPQLSLIRPERV